jgi:sporulation protein YlmC with PRC-barrel domain
MRNQITELFGLQVYTDRGVFVGEIEDVVIDINEKKMDALVIAKVNPELVDLKNFKGLKIPYRLIKSIGDVMVIRHVPAAFRSGAGESDIPPEE